MIICRLLLLDQNTLKLYDYGKIITIISEYLKYDNLCKL